MADNFLKVYNGMSMVTRSADPSNPVEGDVQFADGTARAKGLWEYKDGAWSAIGGGAPGGGGGSSTTYQTKVITTNVTAAGDIAEITFNNLTIGNTYRISGTMTFRSVGTGTGTKNVRFTIKDGATDIGAAFVRAYQGTTSTVIIPTQFDVIFQATATTVVPDLSSVSSMEILADNPSSSSSSLTLEELPDHTAVTTWT